MSITDNIRKLTNEQLIAEATGWQTTPHALVLGERLATTLPLVQSAKAILARVQECSKSLPGNSKGNDVVNQSALEVFAAVLIPCELLRDLRDAVE